MRHFVLLGVTCLSVAAPAVAEQVTFERLLGEMTDLERLATWPEPAYVTKQASSYDRASVEAGKDSWFANGDAGHFVRVERHNGREEFVLLDAEGPGVVVRMWSAKPSGIMRIYIDGSDRPELEVGMEDLLSGKVAPIGEPFAGIRARGYNLYFPIPYTKHCKITTDVGGYHYHVDYRTYEPGTKMESFKRSLLTEHRKDIQTIAVALSADGLAKRVDELFQSSDSWQTTTSHLKGAYTYRSSPASNVGPGALTGVAFEIRGQHLPQILRSLLIEFSFDGEKTVSCPIGDFFGIAGRIESYSSIATGVEAVDRECVRLWSFWPMPFRKRFDMRLAPVGEPTDAPVTIKHHIRRESREWTGRSMYFHAGWRLTKDIPSRPFTDWTHLEATGRGRFVGSALHVINYHRGWWGEGDEKIFVDGETFPSFFGTGSEDYYGYAWCDPTPFTHAYHNQVLCDGPGTYGNTVLNRWHIIDDIPFTKSFRFDMENWHQIPETKTTRAATSYWYARPGGSDAFEPLNERGVEYVEVPEYIPYREPGVIEGESLEVVGMTAGETRIMDRGESYSGEKSLWWLGGRPGDTLTLGFDAPADGRYHVIARLSKGHDFGILSVSVNGRKVIDQRDLFEPLWFARMPEEDLGVFDLKPTGNTLTVEVAGKNEKAQDHYAFGIDYLKLKPE